MERVIREDLAEIMALREDLAYVQGSGAGEEPRGIRNVVLRLLAFVGSMLALAFVLFLLSL